MDDAKINSKASLTQGLIRKLEGAIGSVPDVMICERKTRNKVVAVAPAVVAKAGLSKLPAKQRKTGRELCCPVLSLPC